MLCYKRLTGDWRHDKYYSKRVESVNSDRSNLNFSVENRLFSTNKNKINFNKD